MVDADQLFDIMFYFGYIYLSVDQLLQGVPNMQEIIFQVVEDEIDGGYSASSLGHGIHTEAETMEELRANIKEAIVCHFTETAEIPKVVRLIYSRDEVFAL